MKSRAQRPSGCFAVPVAVPPALEAVVPPLASEGRPAESVPVVADVPPLRAVAPAPDVAGRPVSALLGRPGPGSELTRVSPRPQPPENTDAASATEAKTKSFPFFMGQEFRGAARTCSRARLGPAPPGRVRPTV